MVRSCGPEELKKIVTIFWVPYKIKNILQMHTHNHLNSREQFDPFYIFESKAMDLNSSGNWRNTHKY